MLLLVSADTFWAGGLEEPLLPLDHAHQKGKRWTEHRQWQPVFGTWLY